MGEIAEMMLDGTLDCETGEYLGDGPGYPRTTESFGRDPFDYAYAECREKKFACAVCKKKFATEQGKIMHEIDKHGHTKNTAICPGCGKVTRGLKQHMEAKGCVPKEENS